MSKTIDQKVVEMQFDNRQFEKNVSTTMSSVEKLKQSLNFSNAGKGLENISAAAKRVDMNSLGNAVESVHAKFSALQVMGVTALANITNSAVNAGKRMVAALTIDPITTGFQEYETQMNAVQTILANTSSKGTTLSDVTAALDELNKYADQTIYNFTEMTRNIGTFTAAGVDLDKSVTSIKGIANLAAVSGSNSQQAATAMYQLSQALAAGKVQLMDWNSVVNAGMGGELFQNALIRTATQMGTNVDALIEKYGSFRESLTKGEWLTAEVLTETLTQLSGAYTEADLIAQGYTKSQAKEIVELANTAVSAATDVKTFTQLWDTMKESVTSGWAQTWQLIIGDFEEAKVFLTELSNLFGGIIQSFSDSRNNLLKGALSSPWDNLIEKVNEAGIATDKFESAVIQTAKDQGIAIDDLIKKHGSLAKAFQAGALKPSLIIDTLKRFTGSLKETSKVTTDVSGKLEEFNTVVGKVIKGDFGNGAERIKALTDAGYDNIAVQKLVNKVWERNGKNWSDTTITAEELTSVIGELSAAELESIGFTADEAKAIEELARQAEEAGTPLNELINSLEKPSGRELLLDSVMNIINSIINSAKAVGAAWQEIFPPMESTALYSMIEGFNEFTKLLEVNEEVAGKITRTFRGLFSILDIITTIVGGGLKAAIKVLSTVLGAFNLDILDFTAMLGDAAYNLRNFLLDNELVTKAIQGLATGIVSAVTAIRGWIDAFLQIPSVQTAIENLQNAFVNLKDNGIKAIDDLWKAVTEGVASLPDLLFSVGQDIIAGFQNGLADGFTSIPEMLIQIGKNLLQAIKDVLGIHSPSTEFYEIATNIIDGLLNGLKAGAEKIIDFVRFLGSKIVELLGDINWGTVIGVGMSVGLLYASKKMADAIGAFASPLEGIGDILSGVGEVIDRAAKPIAKTIKSFANVMNSYALSIKADALKSIATAIAILAGSVFLLAQLDTPKLWEAIGALAALAAILGVLSIAIGKWGPENALKFAGFATAVLGISTSLLIIGSAIKKLESLNPETAQDTINRFITIVGSLMVLVASYGVFVKGEASRNISKMGTMMLKLSVSLLLMVGVIKLISGLDAGELLKGGVAITAFVGIVAALSAITKLSGSGINKLGSMMLKLTVALGLMVGVIKLISGLNAGELLKGGAAITAFVAILGTLSVITNLASPIANKLGTTLLAMSASMLIMAGVVKILGGMSVADLVQGTLALTAFSGVIALLVSITKLAAKETPQMAATLLAMSASIGILASVAVILGLIDIAGLAKGIVAVGLLSTFMALMTVATRGANDVKGNLIAISVAIGIMAASVAALSFIDPTKLTGATMALSIVMGMFAIVIQSTNNVKGSLATLITMTTAVGLLAGIIYLLSDLPVESTLGTAAALSTLLLSLSASMVILSKAGKVSASTMGALGALTLAIGGLAAIMGVLDYLEVEPSIETATALSTLLLAMSAVCVVLSGVGAVAPLALKGALAFDGVILVIGGLMAGLGALVSYFPQLEQFVNKGIGLLEAVGQGIGGFVGGIIGGVLSGITSALPDVGSDLSEFMENLSGFIEGSKEIKPENVKAIASLAKMILTLTAADVVNSIASFFGLTGSLGDFAAELIPFGEGMAEFSDIVKDVDPEALDAVTNAGLMLAELNKSLPKSGGALQSFLGEQDLGLFGEQLAVFGEAIVGFSNKVSGNVNPEAVEAAANAGMTLAELNKTIPKSGGALQSFLGEQDLGLFGEQLKVFGEAIVAFSQTVAGNVDPAAVEAAANAGKTMAELSANLPKQGGFLQSFLGSQDLGVFGAQLKAFGEAVVAFSDAVGDNIDAEAVEAAANAGKTMAELANNLPKQDGIFQIFSGQQDMAVFGSQLAVFGKYFAEYAGYMKDVDADVVTATSNAADSLVDLANSLPEGKLFGLDTTLDEFGKQLAKFGEYFADYYNEISSVNVTKLNSAIDGMTDLIEMAKGINGIDFGSLKSFGSNLKKLGANGVDDFISAFTDSTSEVKTAASNMIDAFVDSAESRESQLTNAFSSLVDSAVDEVTKREKPFRAAGENLLMNLLEGFRGKTRDITSQVTQMTTQMVNLIRQNYSNFRSAGSYLVDGFADGIRSNSKKAKAQAEALADSVTRTINNALQIRSPSRVLFQIGEYVVEGLVTGISSLTGNAEGASADLGNAVVEGITGSLGTGATTFVVGEELGSAMVDGISTGITSNASVEQAASDKAQAITEIFEKEFEKLDVADQTAELEAQLNNSNEDYTKKYQHQLERVVLALQKYKATLEVYGQAAIETQKAYNEYLQEEIDLRQLADEEAQRSFENSMNWIEKKKGASELSLIEELSAWKRVQARYLEGTEQRIQADEEVLRLQEEINNATEEYYDTLNDIQESANAERLQIDQDYEDERTKIEEDAENQRLQINQDYEDEKTRITEEANQKRLELDQEYADETQRINDQLKSDIESLEQAYEDAVQSRADSLYDTYGLFDQVKDGEFVSGEVLTENLKGQLAALEEWTKNINELAGKGLDEAFIEELREMGPSSAEQIKALNSMTDEELNAYVELWRAKHQLVKDQAVFEYEGLREETDEQIEQLKKDAETNLEELRETWQQQLQELDENTEDQLRELRSNWRQQLRDLDDDTDRQLREVRNTWKNRLEELDEQTNQQLEDLKTDWMQTVVGLKTETESQFTQMTANVINTLGERSQWTETGANMIEGVLIGVMNNTPKLVAGVEDAMREALEAAEETLGIASPSKKFARIGRYSVEGFAYGMAQYANLVTDSVTSIGDRTVNTLQASIARIGDMIDSGIDVQPTIRPVLDLSEIELGTKRLDTMFAQNQAVSIAGAIDRGRVYSDDQNGVDSSSSGQTFNFTQNNYSPKTLSRVDIYRQTKNQFSTFERMVKA